MSADSPLPPMGEVMPAGVCGYGFGGCSAAATWHIIWTPYGDNGLTCDQHKAETDQRWAYWTAHRYDEPVCSAAGARWIIPDDGEPSYCFLPDDDAVTAVRAAAELPA